MRPEGGVKILLVGWGKPPNRVGEIWGEICQYGIVCIPQQCLICICSNQPGQTLFASRQAYLFIQNPQSGMADRLDGNPPGIRLVELGCQALQEGFCLARGSMPEWDGKPAQC